MNGKDTATEFVECAYCNTLVENYIPPMSNEEWVQAADDHMDECEWVVTRAFTSLPHRLRNDPTPEDLEEAAKLVEAELKRRSRSGRPRKWANDRERWAAANARRRRKRKKE